MCRNRSTRAIAPLVATVVAGALTTTGCELTGVAITAPERVIFAETWAILALDADNGPALDAFAFLHRTLSSGDGGRVPGAVVRLSGESGAVVHLAEQDVEVCLGVPESVYPKDGGSCYRTQMSPSPFAPGERLALEITTPDDRILVSASRVPGAFSFQDLAQEGGRCRLEPRTNFRFEWTPAEDAWAYIADARIEGLPDTLADEDFEVPDSLYLGGRSLGREDTGIIFPRQFGFLEFLQDENRGLVRVLQDGLPEGARAEIAFTAADRNWTNWVRVETFGPIASRRVPSVTGDGTGWFGTATQRRVGVVFIPRGEGQPPLCGPAAAPGTPRS